MATTLTNPPQIAIMTPVKTKVGRHCEYAIAPNMAEAKKQQAATRALRMNVNPPIARRRQESTTPENTGTPISPS